MVVPRLPKRWDMLASAPDQPAALARKVLDQMLVRAAERAGAQQARPSRFEALLVGGERVVGARLKSLAGDADACEIRANQVALATSAACQTFTVAGLHERYTPSGVAQRGYVKCAALARRIGSSTPSFLPHGTPNTALAALESRIGAG